MRRIILSTAAAFLVFTGTALAEEPAAKAAEPVDEGKTLYALGVALSQQLQSFYLTEKDLDQVVAGLKDGVSKKAKDFDIMKYRSQFQSLSTARASVAAAEEKKNAEAFLKKMAAEKGAKKTNSGLIYTEMKAGTGKSPKETDRVEVHYHGTLADGTVFDSSVDRKQTATFRLNGVIKCWTEGVQMMKEGGKSKLVCPSEIAYGDHGSPPKIKPGAALVFEVELIKVLEEAPAPAAGGGAAAAPAAGDKK